MTESGTQAHLVLEATAVMVVVVAASAMDHFLGTFGVKQMDDALEEDLAVRNSLYLHFQPFFFSFHLQLQILPTDTFFPLLEFGALKKDS